ncbi:MAG: hypothetical protein ABI401_14860 [Candidatus Dormibacter sp.]
MPEALRAIHAARLRNDPSAASLPEHITGTYPFVAQDHLDLTLSQQ